MDCIKFAGTRKGEVRKTARKAYEKIFAGTRKGERRETVSSRRAYEGVTHKKIEQILEILDELDGTWDMTKPEAEEYHHSMINEIRELLK